MFAASWLHNATTRYSQIPAKLYSQSFWFPWLRVVKSVLKSKSPSCNRA